MRVIYSKHVEHGALYITSYVYYLISQKALSATPNPNDVFTFCSINSDPVVYTCHAPCKKENK